MGALLPCAGNTDVVFSRVGVLAFPLEERVVALVLALADDLLVFRIATELVAALGLVMVGNLIVREGPHQSLVVEAVGMLIDALVVAGEAMTRAGHRAGPQPAAGFGVHDVLVRDETVVAALEAVSAGVLRAERFPAAACTNWYRVAFR
jgi:hypothetical protein